MFGKEARAFIRPDRDYSPLLPSTLSPFITIQESFLSRNFWLEVAGQPSGPISSYEANLVRRSLGWSLGSRGEFDPLPPLPRFEANMEYAVQHDSLGQKALQGWSAPEPWGAWSNGTQGKLVFLADRDRPATLVMRGRLFAPVPDQPPRIYARIDGAPEETLLEARSVGEDIELHILLPARSDASLVQVSLRFDTPRAPADYGVNSDQRLLALGLSWLAYRAAEDVNDRQRQAPTSPAVEPEMVSHMMDEHRPASPRRPENFAALD
jgi:hypothetical protein